MTQTTGMTRAKEVRAIADTMAEGGIKASMLSLESDYDKLADRAEQRLEAHLSDLPSPRPKLP